MAPELLLTVTEIIMKPKEPLLAVLLALVFPGLGQIYSGRVKRGFVFIGVYIGIFLLALSALFYAISPQTHITKDLFILVACFALSAYVFGIFVVIDAYQCVKAFNQNKNLKREITFLGKVLLILGIVVVVFVRPIDTSIGAYIKNNVIQSYQLPKEAGAMMPTMQGGDRLLINKAVYRNSKPQRGDVVVFRYPLEPDRDFVMRLIAFGGETVEIKEGNVYINAQPVTDSEIKNKFYYNRGKYGQAGNVVKVPEGHYFVLGDNSASSHDSRFWGFVPEQNIVGKAHKIFSSNDRWIEIE